MALAPPARQESINPIIPWGGELWRSGQTMECHVLEDPYDPTRLLMFWCGQEHQGLRGGIGLATASVSDPKTWTQQSTSPVLSSGTDPWEVGMIRADCVIYDPVADQFMLYYTGREDPPANDAIGLATAPGNDPTTWTRHPGNPIWTAADVAVVGCEAVSQAAVWRESATEWFLYYSHRGTYGTLPNIRLATSSDGIAWTDADFVSWAKGDPGDFDSQYKEFHQITKVGSDYVLIAECYNGDHWSIGAASASAPDAAFTKHPVPIFEHSDVGYTFDQEHVATGTIFNLDDQWWLFYCGTDRYSPYHLGRWSVGMARF